MAQRKAKGTGRGREVREPKGSGDNGRGENYISKLPINRPWRPTSNVNRNNSCEGEGRREEGEGMRQEEEKG